MRRTCLLLLILPAGLSPVAAADNPFSKPKPSVSPGGQGSGEITPAPQPMTTPLIKPLMPAIVDSNGPSREDGVVVKYSIGKGTWKTESVSGFQPRSMADILLAGLPTQITPPHSPSDMPAPTQLSERQLPSDQLLENGVPSDTEQPEGNDADLDSVGTDDFEDAEEDSPLFAPSIYGKNRLAEVAGERITIPPLITPTTSTAQIGNKTLPDDIGGDALVMSKPLPEGFDRYEDWSLTSYFWQAPNTFSHPLYFDDPMLERHGHERFPCVTPLISGTRFFATIAMLPYLSTVQEPCDCVYTLGHFRPGTCAPPLLKRPPYERRAAIVQGLSTAGYFVAWP